MKVFISWSGERSKIVAVALKQWLRDVIQALEPWVSEIDIETGDRWSSAVMDQVEASEFGIICLTPENQLQPWIHFEAGAVAKLKTSRVTPYLIHMTSGDVSPGPLTRFQSAESSQDGTWDMITALNNRLDEEALDEDRLRRAFDKNWDYLAQVLEGVREIGEDEVATRSQQDIVEEILGIIRRMDNRLSQAGATYLVGINKPDHHIAEQLCAPISPINYSHNHRIQHLSLGEALGAVLSAYQSHQVSSAGDTDSKGDQDSQVNDEPRDS